MRGGYFLPSGSHLTISTKRDGTLSLKEPGRYVVRNGGHGGRVASGRWRVARQSGVTSQLSLESDTVVDRCVFESYIGR